MVGVVVENAMGLWAQVATAVGTPLGEALRQLRELASAAAGLGEREAQLASLCDTLRVAVYQTDAQGRLLYVNERGREWFGMAPSGDLDDLVHPEDRVTVERRRTQAIARGAAWDLEFRLAGTAGRPRWVRDLGTAARAADGTITGWAGTIEDVTGRKRARAEETTQVREQLQRSERLAVLGSLAARIAHDLGNPLASMLSGLELLRLNLEDADPSGTRAADVRPIVEELERCVTFVRRLQTAASAGRREVPASNVNEVVQYARDLVIEPAAAAGAVVRLELMPTLPPAPLHPSEMSHVLVSLLHAAFAAGSACVRVRTARQNGRLVITVEDDGRGVGPADADLGFGIAHDLVADRGGSIDLRNTPGRGTTVTIELPPAVGPVTAL